MHSWIPKMLSKVSLEHSARPVTHSPPGLAIGPRKFFMTRCDWRLITSLQTFQSEQGFHRRGFHWKAMSVTDCCVSKYAFCRWVWHVGKNQKLADRFEARREMWRFLCIPLIIGVVDIVTCTRSMVVTWILICHAIVDWKVLQLHTRFAIKIWYARWLIRCICRKFIFRIGSLLRHLPNIAEHVTGRFRFCGSWDRVNWHHSLDIILFDIVIPISRGRNQTWWHD